MRLTVYKGEIVAAGTMVSAQLTRVRRGATEALNLYVASVLTGLAKLTNPEVKCLRFVVKRSTGSSFD
jgi:hypothetical protein